MPHDAAVILLSAGSGIRLGAGCAKALVPLAGQAMVSWSARTFAELEEVRRLVLVVPAGEEGQLLAQSVGSLNLDLVVVEGGARRRDSVAAGLAAVGSCESVLVHDAARPLVSADLAHRVLEAAQEAGAGVPALPVADTLVQEAEGWIDQAVDRSSVRAIQTPQGFDTELLQRAHRQADPDWDASDDSSMVRGLGEAVALVDGDPENFKITWPEDLERAEAIVRSRQGREGDRMNDVRPEVRIGLGWDVHPLIEGRPYDLVGVRVADDFGPKGHSDGDPLSHAIADAMLGAAGLGDIGTHFPDTDPRFSGIAGPDLLAQALEKVRSAGWRPVQVDAVLITDRPKIAPHREAIRGALADLLEIPGDAISVKGKRSEGLGMVAGGAGTCCECLVQMRAIHDI